MIPFANSCAAMLVTCLSLGGISFACAADAAPAHEVKGVRAGDVELHYVEQGKGVPVIFVHGSVDDYRTFEPQLEPLSRHYRVISYSRRYNFPNAANAPSGNHSALVEADDLASLLKALGAYPAHVVGHSYGAYTALILAMKHPELVRSVVLAEPPLLRWLPQLPSGEHLYADFMNNMWEPTGREFRLGHAEQALRITIDWFGKNGYLIEGKPAQFDALPTEIRAFMVANSLEWQALTTSSDAFPMLDRAAVKAITVPILLMSGENTMKMNKKIDAELKRLLPKAETVVIPGATHEMWAEQPDVCRARVAAFLAKH
ncbi:MAG TPA: alpha/beta hydrolase [Chthoniobacterales bacterium]